MTMNYLQFLINFLSKVLGAELENSGVIGFHIALEEVSNSIRDIYN